MHKFFLIVAAAALIAGTAFVDPALARRGGDSRGDMTAEQIVAQADARIARIKADLRLTAEQEKNWPAFESAMHDISKSRADRLVALRAKRGEKKSADVIEYLNDHATFLGELSGEVKKIADAAQPLNAILDDQQKRRFAPELVRLSRDRDRD